MTIKEVEKRIEQIKTCAGDYEVQHGLEDALWEDVLHAIAHNPSRWGAKAKALALAALKTKEIKFARSILCIINYNATL